MKWKEKIEKSKNICVFGGGTTGRSVIRFFQRKNIQVFLVDSNTNFNECRIFSDETPPNMLPEYDLLIKSPGISPDHKILAWSRLRGIPILSDIYLGKVYFNGKIIGITGTDGKSTTTALTAHILEKSKPGKSRMGGNIGIPFLDFCEDPIEYAILELSSYQLDDSLPLHLHSSAYLNLAPDHLDRHKTMDNYHSAKFKICSTTDPDHHFITNEKLLPRIQENLLCRLYSFGVGEGCHARILPDEKLILTSKGAYQTNLYPLLGNHNLENLAASILLCESIGLSKEEITNGYSDFPGLPHRFQEVHVYGETKFINDSKSTNLHSMLNGIRGFRSGKGVVLILGGRPKNEPLEILIQKLDELQPDRVYIYGEAAIAWKELYRFPNVVRVYKPSDAIESIRNEYEQLKPKYVVFSPACASFDLFKNFEERGIDFIDCVKRIFFN